MSRVALHEIEMLFGSGEISKAYSSAQDLLANSKERKDKKNEALALHLMGVADLKLGNVKKAETNFISSLKLKNQIGDKRLLGTTYHQLGIIFYEKGDYKNAEKYFRQALKISEEFSDQIGMATAYYHLGIITQENGDYRSALEFFKEAQYLFEDSNDKNGMVAAYRQLGIIYINLLKYQKASDYFNKSLKIVSELDDKRIKASLLHDFGLLAHKRGKLDDALEYYNESIEIEKRIGDLKGLIFTYNNIGLIKKGQRDYESALSYYEKSLKIAKKINDAEGTSITQSNIGNALVALGNWDEAKKVWEEAIEEQRALGKSKYYADLMLNSALGFSSIGEHNKAKNLLKESFTLFKHLGMEPPLKAKQFFNNLTSELGKAIDKKEIIEDIRTQRGVELSKNQTNAVVSESEYIKVIAGAGAGKTETLIRRIVKLLLCDNVDPSSIVAFTFTEKAAQSMKSRLYQRISDMGREDIASNLGRMFIGTIHSFCLEVLKDHFGYGDFKVLDENQLMAFLLRFGWELELDKIKGAAYGRNCEDFMYSLNVFYGEKLDYNLVKKSDEEFYYRLKTFEDLLDKNHRFIFDRIIYEAVTKIRDDPEKLTQIKHLIVDEFQDINKAQFTLIKIIGEIANIFVVGDPRQTIYQWRGSDERFFHEFSKHFSGAEKIDIAENWRSTSRIVEVSNGFAENFSEMNFEPMESRREVEGEVTKLSFGTPIDEAEWIADQIANLVNENGNKYSDFAILLRSVYTAGDPFISAFKKREIPYIVGGKIGLFKRDEAQAIGRLFSWFSDGFWIEDMYNWRERTTGDKLLYSGIDYWKSAVNFPISDRRLIEDLEELKENISLDTKYKDFKKIYHDLLVILGYRNFDPNDKLHAALMANLGRFSSILGDFEDTRRLGGGRIRLDKELNGFCWYINTYALRKYDEKLEDFRQVNAVGINTIHQSKGLEWPIVFLPSLTKGRFPSRFAGSDRRWLIKKDLFDSPRYEGGIEDEKRLFYVAITRARDKSILSYFKKIRRSTSQSSFLNIIDKLGVNSCEGSSYTLSYEPDTETTEGEILTFPSEEIIHYIKCPYHYRFQHRWGYTQSHSKLIGYSESLRYCISHVSKLIRDKGYDPIDAVIEAVNEKFFLPYAGEGLNNKYKIKAETKLNDFTKKYKNDMKNVDELETRIEFPVENAIISGRVDVILKDNGLYEIRDYKTSDKVITYEDSAFQLRLHSLGLGEVGWDIDRGSVANLSKASIDEVTVDEIDLNNAKLKAEEVIKNIKKGCFDATPSEFCKKCEYSKICKWKKQ